MDVTGILVFLVACGDLDFGDELVIQRLLEPWFVSVKGIGFAEISYCRGLLEAIIIVTNLTTEG